MKKVCFFALTIFFLGACNPDRETIIKNNSDFATSFQYSDQGKAHTLNPGESVSIEWQIESLLNLQPWNRVSQNYDKNHILTISNLPSYEVYVDNRTDNPITLTAGGWMDDMINIQGEWKDDNNHKGRIYTDKPNFNVPGYNFPLAIQYQLVNGIFYVVIRP